MLLSENALNVYKKLYLAHNEDMPAQTHRRVANTIGNSDTERLDFFNALDSNAIRPNTPVLINAGIEEKPQLAACYVGNLEDSLESIFEFDKEAGLIYAKGSGVGANYGALREKGGLVNNNGHSSGAFAFMRKLAATAECVVSGGKNRRSAHIAIFTDNHPDIEEFITIKNGKDQTLRSMNLSVALTDKFMEAVNTDANWDLIGVKDKQVKKTLKAKYLFNQIVDNAYKTGDPGLIFIDTANRDNGLINWKRYTASNPCSEQFLLPYGSCNLAHINLNNCLEFVDNKYSFNFNKLQYYAALLTVFCDNAIDIAGYPTENYTKTAKYTRNIGVGLMGLADIFIKLNISYDSPEAIMLAGEIARQTTKACIIRSAVLAEEKGCFPLYVENKENMLSLAMKYFNLKDNTEHDEWEFVKQHGLRNSQWTTIAPCGTTSISADCSSGVEPHFAIVYEKHISDSDDVWNFINPIFKTMYSNTDWYDEAIHLICKNKGSCQGISIIPDDVKRLFKTAHDIGYVDKISMVASLQKGISNSISHTLNLPHDIAKETVSDIYMMAWQKGLKGVTVYRDGSLNEQPVTFGKQEQKIDNTNSFTGLPELYKKELLDIEKAERHRCSWKNSRIYINVSIDENDIPVELFTKLPREAGINGDGVFNIHTWSERCANWDLISRLVSLALRYSIPLSDIISQCDKSKASLVDAAGILSRVLKKYLVEEYQEDEEGNVIGNECPDCGNKSLINDGGCCVCYECNFSKCG